MYIDKSYILKKINSEKLNILSGGDDANIEDAIQDASDVIDGYIRNVVTLPIDEEQVPLVIKRICYDITIYYLHDRVDYVDVPEAVETKYKEAMKLLKGISSGEVNLVSVEDDKKSNLIDGGSDERQFYRNSQ